MPQQAELIRLYGEWRESLQKRALGFDPRDCSAPLLIKMPDAYAHASRRVLFCGQETYGWGWMGLTEIDEATGRESVVQEEARTLKDFLHSDGSITTLLSGYEKFAFAAHYHGRGAPFWIAFREVQAWGLGEVLWTNLSRFDYQGASILKSPFAEQAISAQSDLLAGEISITKPDTAIFVTGPRYDWILEQLFPGLIAEPVAGSSTVLKLRHSKLPAATFRTYHPAALRRQRRWGDLQVLRDAIKGT